MADQVDRGAAGRRVARRERQDRQGQGRGHGRPGDAGHDTNAGLAARSRSASGARARRSRARSTPSRSAPPTVTATAGSSQATRCCTTLTPQPGASLKITEAVPADEKVVSTSPAAPRDHELGERCRQGHGGRRREHRHVRERARRAAADRLRRGLQGRRRRLRLGTFHFAFSISARPRRHTSGRRRRRAHPRRSVLRPDQGRRPATSTSPSCRSPNTYVAAASGTIPTTLGPTNLTNGTATVVVPVSSDTSSEVQRALREQDAHRRTLKICKYLTASSGALAGQDVHVRRHRLPADGGHGRCSDRRQLEPERRLQERARQWGIWVTGTVQRCARK